MEPQALNTRKDGRPICEDAAAMTAAGRYGKATVGVLTVIQEEFDAAKKALEARKRYKKTRYWHAENGPEGFVLAKMPDRSNNPAGEATRDMLEHWRPDVLVLTGIAGGLSSGAAGLGDVVVPDFVHYGEFRKLTEHGDDLRFAAYDHPTVGLRTDIVEGVREEDLWTQHVLVDRPEMTDEDHHGSDPSRLKVEIGGLVSAEKIMGDPDHPEQQRMFANFEHAIAVDMESWGFGRAIHHGREESTYNPRMVIIRGISDIVQRPAALARGEDAPEADLEVTKIAINNEQRRRWKDYAAGTAAAFTRSVVEDITDDA